MWSQKFENNNDMFEKEKKMIRFRKLYKAEFRVVFKVF